MNKTDDSTHSDNSPAASAAGLFRLPKGMKEPPGKLWEHHFWTGALNRLKTAVMDQPDSAIIALVGPTGAGKSALVGELMQHVFDEYIDDFADPGRVPWAYVEVRSSENRGRIWGATARHVLTALHEPLIEHKLKPDKHDVRVKNPDDQALLDIDATCLNRKTRLLVFDEFHHLLRGTEAESQHRKLEMLKGLSNTTGTKSVIIGTTDILKALDGYQETARRTVTVMMPRYRTTAKDLADFRRLITDIESELGNELEVSLTKEIAYAWDATKGCVGLLSTWIANARTVASNAGMPITRAILDGEMLSAGTRKRIDEQAIECEEYVATQANRARDQLRAAKKAVAAALA